MGDYWELVLRVCCTTSMWIRHQLGRHRRPPGGFDQEATTASANGRSFPISLQEWDGIQPTVTLQHILETRTTKGHGDTGEAPVGWVRQTGENQSYVGWLLVMMFTVKLHWDL